MEEIKNMLIAACSDGALSGDIFFDECIGSFRSLAPFFPEMQKDPLYMAARDLCKLSDLETGNPYHNSTHTREAVYSSLLFSCLQFSGCAHLRRRAALVCSCAMAAHDLGHDGGINKDVRMRLEIKAWNIAKDVLARRGADPHSKNLVRFCVLSTDPSVLADRVQSYLSFSGSVCGMREINARAGMSSPFQKICGLICNGSDVCASALVGYGEVLGQKLSEEWMLSSHKTPRYSHGKDFAEKICTFTGRLNFLVFASGLADALECFRKSGWHRHFIVQFAALAFLGIEDVNNDVFGRKLLPEYCSGWVSKYGSAMKFGAAYLDSLDKQSSETLWLQSLERAAAVVTPLEGIYS